MGKFIIGGIKLRNSYGKILFKIMTHMQYTFKTGRKCRRCSQPISDQEHLARKYCKPKTFPDGRMENCKDKYNSPIRKKLNAPYVSMAQHHKLMHNRITSLAKVKGNTVSLEEINLWGIILQRCFQFEVKDGKFIFYFHEFAIADLGNKRYKISSHGLF
jgi:hypothetical protein